MMMTYDVTKELHIWHKDAKKRMEKTAGSTLTIYVLSLKTNHKNWEKKKSYFWQMTYDGMGNKLERTMNGREI